MVARPSLSRAISASPAPARSTSASSIQPPPARACPCEKGGGGHRHHQLIASVGSGGSGSQVRALVNQVRKAQVPGQGGRQDQTGIGRQAVPSKAMRIRSGWLRDRIYRVLLFWSRLWVSKTLIPEAHEHPLACSSHH